MKLYTRISEGKLAEYDVKNADNAEFWSSHWGKNSVETSLKKAEKGYLGGSKYLMNSIRKDDRVLEAGCGKGQIVAAMDHLGIDIVGLDFSEDIIEEIKDYRPDLKVQGGDIRDLEFDDHEFTVYLSFGVIEHFDDPKEVKLIMDEAKRVTSRLIYFSVPYFSPAIKRTANSLKSAEGVSQDKFYQYYFDRNEIEKLLLEHGLKIEKTSYYATYVGLKRYNKLFNFLNKFYPCRFVFLRLRSTMDRLYGKKYAHMMGLWTSKIDD